MADVWATSIALAIHIERPMRHLALYEMNHASFTYIPHELPKPFALIRHSICNIGRGLTHSVVAAIIRSRMALLSTTRGFFQAFGAELALLFRILLDRRLAWLALAITLMLSLVAQLSPRYSIDIGREDGPGADLPLISGFNTSERDAHGTFRWTGKAASINLTGFGSRPLFLSLHLFPINAEIATRGPQNFELWMGSHQLGVLPVHPQGRSYHVMLPPDPNGEIVLGLRSATIIPSGDERELGIVLDRLDIAGNPGAYPDWRSLVGWLGLLLLAWLAVRRLEYDADTVALMLMPAVGLLGLAAALDPPRLSLGIIPALTTLGLSLGLVLVMCAAPATLALLSLLLVAAGAILGNAAAELLYPSALTCLLAAMLRQQAIQLWARLEPEVGIKANSKGRFEIGPNRQLRILALLGVLVFALHYGGKIYPFSMPGDIGFHINRFREAIAGRIFILSKNRGVDFPYPPALYAILAPLTLISGRGTLLHLSAALMDALSPALVYLIARRSGLLHSWQAAVAAGTMYAFSGALFMTTWWNFSTHIFAQFAQLMLVTVLVVMWGIRGRGESGTGGTVPWMQASALLIFMQLILYLAHFGFWINMSLISAMGLSILAVYMLWRRKLNKQFCFLLGTVVVAQLVTVLLFYSAYTDLFMAQLSSTAAGGLTGLAGRGAVSADVLWAGLIEGLYAHLGMLPILLAPLTLLLPLSKTSRSNAARLIWVLMLTSFVLGLAFALLPFVTGSTLSTRWLMFCLWAICVAWAALSEQLWQRGRAGRVVLMASYAYIFWLSAVIWLSALAWRVRPPEPF